MRLEGTWSVPALAAPKVGFLIPRSGLVHPILCAGKGYVPGITAIYKRHRLPQSAARVALIAQLHITMAVLLG